jgi:hypothetical protein
MNNTTNPKQGNRNSIHQQISKQDTSQPGYRCHSWYFRGAFTVILSEVGWIRFFHDHRRLGGASCFACVLSYVVFDMCTEVETWWCYRRGGILCRVCGMSLVRSQVFLGNPYLKQKIKINPLAKSLPCAVLLARILLCKEPRID